MIQHKLYTSVDLLPKDWDTLPCNDIFLKTPFLRGLENACPNNITPFYFAVYKHENLVGIGVVQRVQMYVDDVFRRTSRNYLKQIAKRLASKIVKGNALVVGSLMHTGQHGLFY